MVDQKKQFSEDYKYGFRNPDEFVHKLPAGLSKKVVEGISWWKSEPEWMLEKRLKALEIFYKKPALDWGADLSSLDFEKIHYYVKSTRETAKSWEKVPKSIKDTFQKLGIPEAEQKYLAGVEAQYESEVVYSSVKTQLEKQGVIFMDSDTAMKKHPDIIKKYFGTLIPPSDNKFAALNTAVWSGGSFVYVPPDAHVELPLQAYFRINTQNMGQFERTLIIADEGSSVHYVEGCTAPIYSTASLHSAVVEIFVKPGARVRYTTVQNWSKNVYNLVTKRAYVEKNGIMEWLDGNLGSAVTMKYPSVFLAGEEAHGEVLSIALAGNGQHQDAGGKAVHLAPKTSSVITSKSISLRGGRASYRGLLHVLPKATEAKAKIKCDALILDEYSRSDTYPTMKIEQENSSIEHEATVSKIADDQLFYMMSRGLEEAEAESMIVNGFIEPIVRQLPFEYAIELNRLIGLEMEGSVG
jgi:Fe-S cluster assembly protein SufB